MYDAGIQNPGYWIKRILDPRMHARHNDKMLVYWLFQEPCHLLVGLGHRHNSGVVGHAGDIT